MNQLRIVSWLRCALMAGVVFSAVVPAYAQRAAQSLILSQGAPAPAEAPQRLTVATYNVLMFHGCPEPVGAAHFRSDEQRINEFARVFESIDADVFALQEAPEAKFVRGVAEKLNYYSARTTDPGVTGGAILSRYPIREFESYKDYRDDAGPVFSRHFWRALLDLGGGKRLLVYGTHFHPSIDINGTLHRIREMNALVVLMRRTAQPGVPQIVMGDFNVRRDESLFGILLEMGFRDAYLVKPVGPPNTCNAIHPYIRVDRIFIPYTISDGLVGAGTVRNAYTTPSTEEVTMIYSDHLPVRAEIVLPGPSEPIQPQQRPDLTIEVAGRTYKLRWISPGTFEMGSASGTPMNQPKRTVTLTQGFWMLEHEVPVALWRAVMGDENNGHGGDTQLPVVNVSYDEIRVFLEKLSAKVPGHTFALPTEAQWEYAARAGVNVPEGMLTGSPEYNRPAGHRMQRLPVTTGEPNPWGLRGMLGNVREWCRDAYHPDAYTFLPSRDPVYEGDTAEFAVRGSAYLHEYGGGFATRIGKPGDHRDAITGFRFVVLPKDSSASTEAP